VPRSKPRTGSGLRTAGILGLCALTFVDRDHLVIWSAACVAGWGANLFYEATPERRERFTSRLALRPVNLAEVGAGFALGGAMLTSVVAWLWARGWYRTKGLDLSPSAVGSFAIFVLAFLVVGVAEEILSRGLLFRWIEDRAGSWAALVGSSVVFAVAHGPNPHASLVAIAGLVVAGLMFAAIFAWRRTLWLVIGIHWAWNLFEGPVWGTPVSGQPTHPLVRAVVRGPVAWTGGRFGPEAGWAVVIVSAAIGIAALAAAIGSGRFPRSAAARSAPAEEPATAS
jgi:membrane protease YdiL (CAAX protease family)